MDTEGDTSFRLPTGCTSAVLTLVWMIMLIALGYFQVPWYALLILGVLGYARLSKTSVTDVILALRGGFQGEGIAERDRTSSITERSGNEN